MAVAVKTSPDARSTGSSLNPAILSLVGVVYLLACLAIVFKLLPDLWWQAWASMGLANYQFIGGTLLILLSLVTAVILSVLGTRLLGKNAPVGVRAGVFVGFALFLGALLLARWASMWIEFWAYNNVFFDEQTGLIATVGVAVALLLLGLVAFTRPGMQQALVHLEEGGWFSTTSYKANQGQKVRRATIAGILVLVGAGIYTMLSQGVLRKGSADWVLNIPFTGAVALESLGDAETFVSKLPATAMNRLSIRWPGEGTGWRKDQIVTFESFRTTTEGLIRDDAKLRAAFEQALPNASEADASAYLLAVNKGVIGAGLRELLDEGFFNPAVARRLEALFDQTPWADLASIIETFANEVPTALREKREKGQEASVPAVFKIPSGLLLIDRFAMRSIYTETDPANNVRVVLRGDADLPDGELVSTAKFEEEKKKLQALIDKGRQRTLPKSEALIAPSGRVQYSTLTLLPSVQFTFPLLLLAGSLWLAWRVVNMPSFADFLIATEAEMNKVSWTTQKRLVQDTIVVLVTVVLMAAFLFGMDLAWKQLLSWKPIGVLHIPPEQSQQNKSVEQKRW